MKVEVRELKRYYGKFKAVDNLSFEFVSGQVFGFIGPNGAGKSTTMRIMATLDEPTAGGVFIDGISVVDDPEKTRRLVGYVPDELPAHRDISVHEYLDFFARAYGLKGAKRKQVVESVEEFTNLIGIREKHLNALSKGMKNRVSVARALVHDPPVLLMDEPASGLDPRARIELYDLLKVLSDQGKGVLISSHILTELDKVCNGAVIIERGKVLRAGTLDQIRQGDKAHRTLWVRPLERAKELYEHALTLPNVESARLIDAGVEVDVLGADEAAAALLGQLIAAGYRVVEFRPQQVDLEQVFMNVTRGDVQ